MTDLKRQVLIFLDQLWRRRWTALAFTWAVCLVGWFVVAMLVALFFGHGWAAEFEPVGVRVEARKLTARAWFVQGDLGMVSRANEGFNSNAGFVVTDEGVVVFDTLGTPALGAELLRVIRRVTDRPIRHVVVSHYHAEHFYGLQAFGTTGADVWAHRLASGYLSPEAPAARLA